LPRLLTPGDWTLEVRNHPAAAGSNNMLPPRCRRTRVMPRVLQAPLLGAWPHWWLTALPGTSADSLGQAHADALASPPLPLGGPTAFGRARVGVGS
jgi:hypothetical protein